MAGILVSVLLWVFPFHPYAPAAANADVKEAEKAAVLAVDVMRQGVTIKDEALSMKGETQRYLEYVSGSADDAAYKPKGKYEYRVEGGHIYYYSLNENGERDGCAAQIVESSGYIKIQRCKSGQPTGYAISSYDNFATYAVQPCEPGKEYIYIVRGADYTSYIAVKKVKEGVYRSVGAWVYDSGEMYQGWDRDDGYDAYGVFRREDGTEDSGKWVGGKFVSR